MKHKKKDKIDVSVRCSDNGTQTLKEAISCGSLPPAEGPGAAVGVLGPAPAAMAAAAGV